MEERIYHWTDWLLGDVLGGRGSAVKGWISEEKSEKEQRPELDAEGMDWHHRQVKMDSDGRKTGGRRGEREIGGDVGREEEREKQQKIRKGGCWWALLPVRLLTHHWSLKSATRSLIIKKTKTCWIRIECLVSKRRARLWSDLLNGWTTKCWATFFDFNSEHNKHQSNRSFLLVNNGTLQC